MLKEKEALLYTVKLVCLDSPVTEGHLLRKIEKEVDFSRRYGIVDYLYC